VTDQVVYMAELNVAANFAPAERSNIHVQVLRWGNAEEVAAALALGCGNGDTPNGRPYDLILGSDCIYFREHHARLAATIDALSGPATAVLWVSPDGGVALHLSVVESTVTVPLNCAGFDVSVDNHE
jgi:predicted nicotinamide N-methyase